MGIYGLMATTAPKLHAVPLQIQLMLAPNKSQ